MSPCSLALVFSKTIFVKVRLSTLAAPKQTNKISPGGHDICLQEGVQFPQDLNDKRNDWVLYNLVV